MANHHAGSLPAPQTLPLTRQEREEIYADADRRARLLGIDLTPGGPYRPASERLADSRAKWVERRGRFALVQARQLAGAERTQALERAFAWAVEYRAILAWRDHGIPRFRRVLDRRRKERKAEKAAAWKQRKKEKRKAAQKHRKANRANRKDRK